MCRNRNVSARSLFFSLYFYLQYGSFDLFNWCFTLGIGMYGTVCCWGSWKKKEFSCVNIEFSFCILEAKNYLFVYFHHVLNLFDAGNTITFIQCTSVTWSVLFYDFFQFYLFVKILILYLSFSLYVREWLYGNTTFWTLKHRNQFCVVKISNSTALLTLACKTFGRT